MQVLPSIQKITESPEYLNNDNDQSVVEICITRVTSAIRENGSIETHISGLVALLESCLKQNLQPSVKDEDPPHAKIASDVMSCIFLVILINHNICSEGAHYDLPSLLILLFAVELLEEGRDGDVTSGCGQVPEQEQSGAESQLVVLPYSRRYRKLQTSRASHPCAAAERRER